MGKLILLFITVVLSSWGIYHFHDHPGDSYNESLNIYSVLSPGIVFSIFLLICQYKKLSIIKYVFTFILLVITYYLAFYCSLISWGWAVPFAGGIGTIIIDRLLTNNPYSRANFLVGFIAGLIGVILYYCLNNDRLGFALIIAIWQLAYGIAFIITARSVTPILSGNETPSI